MADMADTLDALQLLLRLKAKLIPVLSVQADFVLQHADSLSLVTPQGYRQIKSCRVPDEKVRDLLDHVMERGPQAAQGLLDLLKNQEVQEAFPDLHFITSVQAGSACSETQAKSRRRKRKRRPETREEEVPPKRNSSSNSGLVTEKQMMTAARAIGRPWRQVAIEALEVPSVKLEQIEADHPHCLVNQVFAALSFWRNVQGTRATASRLHLLLSAPELALPQEAFSFLMEKS